MTESIEISPGTKHFYLMVGITYALDALRLKSTKAKREKVPDDRAFLESIRDDARKLHEWVEADLQLLDEEGH